MLNKIFKLYKTMKLQSRLILLFVFTTSLPLFMTSLITLTYFYKQNSENAKSNLKEKLNTANIIYQKKLLEIEQISRQVASNNLILVNLELLLYQPISNYLNTFTQSGRLNFLSILDSEGKLMLSGNQNYFAVPQKPIVPQDILEITRQNGMFTSTIMLESQSFNQIEKINTGDGNRIYTMVSIYPVITYDNRILGYVMAGYVLNELTGYPQRASLVTEIGKDINSNVIFIAETQPISYSEGNSRQRNFKIKTNLNDTFDREKVVFEYINVDGTSFLFCLQKIKIYDRKYPVLLGVGISESIFLLLQQRAISIMLGISIFSVIVAAILAVFSSNHISRPILLMVDGTKKIISGDFREHIKTSSNDEIGILAEAFNTMTNKLKRRIHMDTIVSELSRKFINVTRSETNTAINSALEQMAKFIEADRGYVFIFSEDRRSIHNTHEWHLKTLAPQKNYLKNMAVDNFPWFIEKIIKLESVYIPDVSQLPSEAELEKNRWEKQKLISLVCVPMFYGKNLRGFIGFDFHEKPKSSLENDIRLLQIVGEIFCNTLERNLAEERLTHSKNILKGTFDAQTTMLISTDKTGNITLWNSAIAEMTGINSKKASGKKVWEIVSFLSKFESEIRNVLKKNKIRRFEKENIFVKESEKDFFFNITIIPMSKIKHSGVVIKINDITESLKKDTQLMQVQKMETVRTLAGGLAHDFNNVIGAIVATVSFMNHSIKSGNRDIESIKQNLDLIGISAKRAGEIVKQLLTLSRKHEPLFKRTDIRELVTNVVNICHKLLDKSVQINTELNLENSFIYADYSQIEQILLNLCINASHAMTIMRNETETKGGVLTISLANINIDKNLYPEISEGKYILLKVIDTGVGIKKDSISKIFDPFYTTKDKSKGTGLGLSMVLNIIKLHNGYINVYSEEGIGSTFNIFLPEIENRPDDIIEKKDEVSDLIHGSGRILIIDDDETIRQATRRILNSCGYDVIIAEDGLKGIDIYSEMKKEIDLIILDMSMPVISGDQVYLKLKEISSDSIILLTSGFEQDKRVKDLKKLGVNGFIKKPYSMSELSKTVYDLISSKQS